MVNYIREGNRENISLRIWREKKNGYDDNSTYSTFYSVRNTRCVPAYKIGG